MLTGSFPFASGENFLVKNFYCANDHELKMKHLKFENFFLNLGIWFGLSKFFDVRLQKER